MAIQLPNWIKLYGKEKGLRRFRYEIEKMGIIYPDFEFEMEGDTLFVEGWIITSANKNAYRVRIYFPERYPYEPLIPVAMDPDVIENHFDGNITHTRGKYGGGVWMCVMDPGDKVGMGWDESISSVTAVGFASKWFHAYEVWQLTKSWPLPSA